MSAPQRFARSFLARLLQDVAKPKVLAVCFLLCALPTGLGCALLTPVNMVADEQAHLVRADGLRYGQLLGVWPGTAAPGVFIEPAFGAIVCASEYILALPDKPVPPQARRAAETIPWTHIRIFWATQMVDYFPIFYVPSALTLLAGETFGLTPLHSYILGRIAMLFCFVALGTVALALARRGVTLLFALLTLPMSLNLAASYNCDGLLIASCVLAASLLTRTSRPGSSASWWGALLLLSVAGAVKIPYAPLLLFCLLPVSAPGFWRRAACTGLAMMGPGLWLIHLLHTGIFPWPHVLYQPGPLWPGDRSVWLHDVQSRYAVTVFKAHPAAIFWLPPVSLLLHWPNIWREALGSVSVINIMLRPWEYVSLAGVFVAAALGTVRHPPARWRSGDAALALLAIYAVFMGIELSMYLTFTATGKASIDGVQGRYFLPLLPFFIFLLPLAARLLPVRRFAAVQEGWFALPAVCMAIINTYALPAYIYDLYQMPGP